MLQKGPWLWAGYKTTLNSQVVPKLDLRNRAGLPRSAVPANYHQLTPVTGAPTAKILVETGTHSLTLELTAIIILAWNFNYPSTLPDVSRHLPASYTQHTIHAREYTRILKHKNQPSKEPQQCQLSRKPVPSPTPLHPSMPNDPKASLRTRTENPRPLLPPPPPTTPPPPPQSPTPSPPLSSS